MTFGYITLFTALIISIISAYYSISGLVAIFSAAAIPIIVMGASLELGKIITTVWLHKNWHRASLAFKTYLVPAVAFLMILTSIGIFGFLSKAHSDQNLVSGDVQAKIAIFDEKIKISRENIDANRKALKQMDEAVDQVMGRSTTETGADKAVAIRRGQQKERGRLLTEIEAEQKKITSLNDQRAPIAAEVRKVEAEVGPIKYIAKFIYGDNPDANLLEKAVTWVIILIVIVFDPLALTLILAATKTFEWAREDKKNEEVKETEEEPDPIDDTVSEPDNMIPVPIAPVTSWTTTEIHELVDNAIDCNKCGAELVEAPGIGLYCPNTECRPEPAYEPDDGPLTDTQIEQIKETAKEDLPTGDTVTKTELFPLDPAPVIPYEVLEEDIVEEEPAPPIAPKLVVELTPVDTPAPVKPKEKPDVAPWGNDLQKSAMLTWKAQNPGRTLKECLDLLDLGKIDRLPWEQEDHINTLRLSDSARANFKNSVQIEIETGQGRVRGFGIEFPSKPVKGDMFLRVDQQPTQLLKYNGDIWIRVNKNLSDSYAYDDAYIDHLIAKIGTGEYDTELLSNAERDRIEEKLQQPK